ncbi:hypothetical protein E2562_036561 [Oryza meyeriana var. granulata]|uniref:Uncharacterized protein n=1 Tax=Oryza meyeriana var. granulata TaxID=110450 RepID=A0A6G1EBF7_9ORYZ|nr:hypothetical protein E2562_036561 [Oryza meyeriana var. granulata]
MDRQRPLSLESKIKKKRQQEKAPAPPHQDKDNDDLHEYEEDDFDMNDNMSESLPSNGSIDSPSQAEQEDEVADISKREAKRKKTSSLNRNIPKGVPYMNTKGREATQSTLNNDPNELGSSLVLNPAKYDNEEVRRLL